MRPGHVASCTQQTGSIVTNWEPRKFRHYCRQRTGERWSYDNPYGQTFMNRNTDLQPAFSLTHNTLCRPGGGGVGYSGAREKEEMQRRWLQLWRQVHPSEVCVWRRVRLWRRQRRGVYMGLSFPSWILLHSLFSSSLCRNQSFVFLSDLVLAF